MKYNIIIAGIGGQGVVTCGSLISKAAIHAGLNVVMSEIHGLAQRGGSVSVEVRIGDVSGPIIPNGEGDLLIGLEYMEGVRNIPRMKTGSLVILSKEKLTPVSLSMRGAFIFIFPCSIYSAGQEKFSTQFMHLLHAS